MTSRRQVSGPQNDISASAVGSCPTPVAAVTPTLAVSSGLLLDVTESEDEMESLASSTVPPIRPSRGHQLTTSSTAYGIQQSVKVTSPVPVDLEKLQSQVQQLTEIVQTRLSGEDGGHHEKTASSHTVYQHQSYLEEENSRLHETIAIADQQLTQLRQNMLEMEQGFTKELQSLKAQLIEAQQLVQEESRHKHQLQRDMEKALRNKKGLESYINDLPSKDEVDALKYKLTDKSEKLDRLQSRLGEFELGGAALNKRNFILEENCKQLDLEVRDLKLKLAEAESLNRGHSDRLARAAAEVDDLNPTTPAAAGKLEVVMEQRDSLKSENDKLKKYVVYQKNKNEKTVQDLKSSLLEKSDECSSLEQQLSNKREEAESLQGTTVHLRDQIGGKIQSINQLQRKIVILEDQLADSQNSQTSRSDRDNLINAITHKLHRCVSDFKSLSQVSKQLLSGEDPNVSMLLGIESRDHSDNEAEDQGVIAQERDLPRLKSDYDLLKTVHADISELRQVLTDKYAESFTENCKMQ